MLEENSGHGGRRCRWSEKIVEKFVCDRGLRYAHIKLNIKTPFLLRSAMTYKGPTRQQQGTLHCYHYHHHTTITTTTTTTTTTTCPQLQHQDQADGPYSKRNSDKRFKHQKNAELRKMDKAEPLHIIFRVLETAVGNRRWNAYLPIFCAKDLDHTSHLLVLDVT